MTKRDLQDMSPLYPSPTGSRRKRGPSECTTLPFCVLRFRRPWTSLSEENICVFFFALLLFVVAFDTRSGAR